MEPAKSAEFPPRYVGNTTTLLFADLAFQKCDSRQHNRGLLPRFLTSDLRFWRFAGLRHEEPHKVEQGAAATRSVSYSKTPSDESEHRIGTTVENSPRATYGKDSGLTFGESSEYDCPAPRCLREPPNSRPPFWRCARRRYDGANEARSLDDSVCRTSECYLSRG